MTANQFRSALDRLGLTQVGAAKLFGVNDTTVRRWARHGVEGTAVILLRLMVAGKITAEDIERAQSRS
jgi:hypothetical protein